MELLTNTGWKPFNDIEQIIIQVRVNLGTGNRKKKQTEKWKERTEKNGKGEVPGGEHKRKKRTTKRKITDFPLSLKGQPIINNLQRKKIRKERRKREEMNWEEYITKERTKENDSEKEKAARKEKNKINKKKKKSQRK